MLDQESKLAELVAKEEIRSALHRYAYLVDRLQGDAAAREVFADDATEDHGYGIPVHRGHDEIAGFLNRALAPFGAAHHSLSNIDITISGDSAESVAYYLACHWVKTSEPTGHQPADYVSAGYYEDRWRRTSVGWRIYQRKRRSFGPSAVVAGAMPHHLLSMGVKTTSPE